MLQPYLQGSRPPHVVPLQTTTCDTLAAVAALPPVRRREVVQLLRHSEPLREDEVLLLLDDLRPACNAPAPRVSITRPCPPARSAIS